MKRMMHKSTFAVMMAAMVLASVMTGCSGTGSKEKYKGVQIGAITYSWRSMPSTPADIINYCKQAGISSLELMGNVAEAYIGAPAGPAFPSNFREMSEDERAEFQKKREAHGEVMSEWRINEASPETYKELKGMFDVICESAMEKGTRIHQEMEIKGIETGHIEPDEGRNRPFDGDDPWEFKPEVSPTHMNF